MKIFKINNISFKVNIFLIITIIYYSILDLFIESIIMIIIVLLHELSHVLLCVKYGIPVKEIELFPFGGVVRLESFIADKPKKEIMISIVGPLSNILIFLLFYFVKMYVLDNYIINFALKINLYMMFLNLAPLLPLDGGKILRAVLSQYIGFKKATKSVIYLTYIISGISILYLLFNIILNKEGLYLILLATFIIIAATKEKKMAAFIFIKEVMSKKNLLKEKKILKTQILVCIESVTLKSLMNSFLPNRYHIIIIIDKNGNKVKTIYEEEILDAVFKYGLDIKIEKLLIIE